MAALGVEAIALEQLPASNSSKKKKTSVAYSEPGYFTQKQEAEDPFTKESKAKAGRTFSASSTGPEGEGGRRDSHRKPRKPVHLPFLADIKNRGQSSPSKAFKGGLPFIKELATNRLKTPVTSVLFEENGDISSPMSEEGGGCGDGVFKIGNLLKTSQSKTNQGTTRLRKFRLTCESLDYFQTFSHVKVKRSYPLTDVKRVEYDAKENPVQFKLIFSTYVMLLHADNQSEAEDWVKKIKEVWQMWNESDGQPSSSSSSSSVIEDETGIPTPTAKGGPLEDITEEPPSAPSPSPPPSASTSNKLPERYTRYQNRPRSSSVGSSFLRSESYEDTTYDKRRKNTITRRAFKAARLRPQLMRTHRKDVHDPERDYDPSQDKLHYEFSMIKYPKQILSLPSERVFTVDKDNLQILWRPVSASRYRQKSCLSLRKIVEVRKGQQTEGFDKFPYEQVENQSFSLMFESEDTKYVKLTSMDLVCDHLDHFDDWMDGLKTLVTGTQWLNIYPPRYENTDPTILWLKQIWTCKSDNHELKQADAIKLAKKFIPYLTHQDAKTVVELAHSHQVKTTFSAGNALRWDGFVLMFYILCDKNNLQLYDVYLEYAITYPKLGLTAEEFGRFLVKECNWLHWNVDTPSISSLIKNLDNTHHEAIMKFCAANKPREFKLSYQLLSFAGFLSFIRSQDNSIINLEHETVYQDMTQPLSHYFINSSHNTYLEGDQLRGTSSTDAYVRALLYGCRCIEIDCWDDVWNVTGLSNKEPVIYHGHTLTTKVAFRDVIHTINNYGFSSSIYPLIISIENHCSSAQQSKMAKIFRAIFCERLPAKNLVEYEGRERLPSPQELQGKIILKGSYSKNKKFKIDQKVIRKMRSRSQAINIMEAVDASLTDSEPLPPSEGEGQRRRIGSSSGRDQTDGVVSPFNRNRLQRKSVRLKEIKGRLIQDGQDDQELIFTETAKDLHDLIVYCRSVSIKPWSWKVQRETTVSEMFSLGEPTAIELCKQCPRELLACSERQLVRTYPKGTRFDSSNYDPMQMWNCGIQLVALNFQYPGIEMHLNQGFFRQNGGCGYILKPKVMRREDPGGTESGDSRWRAPYNPTMQVPHPEVPTVLLEIELLSGQRLSSWKKKCNYVSVDIQTYGIKYDNTKMRQATSTNSFWSSWGKGEHVLKHEALMPEMCLVYFRVENEGRKIYGQNCFPLVSLLPGIKFVPLRTNGGELIPESGLFVRIKKTKGVDPEGTCPLPNDDDTCFSPIETKENLLFKVDHKASPSHQIVDSPPQIVDPALSVDTRRQRTESQRQRSIDSAPKRVTSPAILQSYSVEDHTPPQVNSPDDSEGYSGNEGVVTPEGDGERRMIVSVEVSP